MSGDRVHGGRPVPRALRAAAFAVVCVYTALGTHMLAGGGGARLGVVAAATAITGAGAFVLAGRHPSMGTLLAAAFAAQYGMHHLFSAGATAVRTPVPGAEHHQPAGLFPGLGMLVAHVLVAMLSAWWLERGDAALLTLLRLLGCALRDLWHPLPRGFAPLAAPRPAPPVAAPAPALRTAQALSSALSRRGPPR
ncbi:MFS transporter [Nonomuraea glycinis]|uniref:MFS transporter n=1 Tax=Nonomuraea glycinis TaxID=2047744 RepID=UPI002E1419B0|nr:MFS transporter [Nonomuraea glycinis]